MGMVGEACLPSNAYYPRTPDYTLCSGVHVCWFEHSDSSFVYGFMILDYGFGTMTATTSQNVLKTKGWNLQCMIKVENSFNYNQKFVPWATYIYKISNLKISSSLKQLNQFSCHFTLSLLSKGYYQFIQKRFCIIKQDGRHAHIW